MPLTLAYLTRHEAADGTRYAVNLLHPGAEEPSPGRPDYTSLSAVYEAAEPYLVVDYRTAIESAQARRRDRQRREKRAAR